MNIKYFGSLNYLAAALHFPTLDIIDLAIFDLIKEFAHSPSCQKTHTESGVFFWVKWNLIVEQLPIINIKTRQGIFARMQKLCDCGLLKAAEDNQSSGRSMFALGAKYDLYINTKGVTFALQGVKQALQGCKAGFTGGVKDALHNTYIKDKDINNKEEEAKASSMVEAKNEADFSYFDSEASARGFVHVLKIAARFEKQKVAEKIKEFSEEVFWGIMQRLENYIVENINEKRKGKYKSLPSAFSTFAGDAETNLACAALNAAWLNKYGTEYKNMAQVNYGEKTALKAIFTQIKGARKFKNQSIEPQDVKDATQVFFERLPERWANIQYFKLATISESYPSIVEAMRNPTVAQNGSFKSSSQINAEYIAKTNIDKKQRIIDESIDNGIRKTLQGLFDDGQLEEAWPNFPPEWHENPVFIQFMNNINQKTTF